MDKNYYILCIFFLILSSLFLTPFIHGKDGHGYYVLTRSFVIDGDLDLENENNYLLKQKDLNVIKFNEKTEKYYVQYMLGTSILQIPFFIIGHGYAYMTGYETNGWTFPYIVFVNLGSALYGFIGILLMYSLLKKYFKKNIALLSVMSLWLASNLFYYMYFESSLSHSISFFTVSLFLWCYFNIEKNVYVLGVCSALMVLVRPQNIIFLSLFLFDLKKDRIKGYIRTGQIFLICIVPQILLLIYNHNSLRAPYNGTFVMSFNYLKVLFSQQHGLFLWTPILFLGFVGLFYLKKYKYRFITIFLLNLLIVGSWSYWYGGQSFSNRLFVNVIPILMFGGCALLERLNKKIDFGYLLFICSLFILWNLGLIIQYGSRMISSEALVPITDIIYNNFITVPKNLITIIKGFFGGKYI